MIDPTKLLINPELVENFEHEIRMGKLPVEIERWGGAPGECLIAVIEDTLENRAMYEAITYHPDGCECSCRHYLDYETASELTLLASEMLCRQIQFEDFLKFADYLAREAEEAWAELNSDHSS